MAKPASAKTKLSKTKAKPARPLLSTNPLLAKWRTPFKMPPFADIVPAHYLPAFKAAFAEHRAEIKAIATATSKATFNNTIVALEKAGEGLNRVAEVFYNLSSSNTNEQLQAIERELAPQFAAHY
jgi:peptidyl-dipeptidase Dcp